MVWWKMVCDKVVCERWCVTKWCERWCVTKMVWWAGRTGAGGRERDTESKTRTLHKDVGKELTDKVVWKSCVTNVAVRWCGERWWVTKWCVKGVRKMVCNVWWKMVCERGSVTVSCEWDGVRRIVCDKVVCEKDGVWQSCVSEMACERWCCEKDGRKMVCDKVVWVRWCVKDGVWQSCVSELVWERWYMTKLPRLPRQTQVNVFNCHACHAIRRWVSPSTTPAPQSGGAPRATNGDQACHQAQQVPRLPRQTQVDVSKCPGDSEACDTMAGKGRRRDCLARSEIASQEAPLYRSCWQPGVGWFWPRCGWHGRCAPMPLEPPTESTLPRHHDQPCCGWPMQLRKLWCRELDTMGRPAGWSHHTHAPTQRHQRHQMLRWNLTRSTRQSSRTPNFAFQDFAMVNPWRTSRDGPATSER